MRPPVKVDLNSGENAIQSSATNVMDFRFEFKYNCTNIAIVYCCKVGFRGLILVIREYDIGHLLILSIRDFSIRDFYVDGRLLRSRFADTSVSSFLDL